MRSSTGNSSGSRTYEIVLVSETAGELTVPVISYAYYDPDLEEYVQATTSLIVVTVAAADGAPPLPPSSVGGAEDERTSLGAKRIRAAPPALRKSGGAMTDSAVYWAMWCLPLLAIAGAAVLRRRRDAWEAALADSRRRNALQNARSTLERVVADGDDHSIAAADAVLSYVSDRFGVSLTGLTREALVERLMDAGVANELAQQIEDTLASGEAARYTPESPSTGHGEDRIRHTTQLLAELDGATRDMRLMRRGLPMLAALCALAVLVAGDASAQESSATSLMTRANERYGLGEYAEAIQQYEGLIDRGYSDAALYFNLGSSYFESGDLGRAILSYLRARKLSPRDTDTRDIAWNWRVK